MESPGIQTPPAKTPLRAKSSAPSGKLFVADGKAYDLRDCRDGPGKDVQQIKGRNGVEIREHGIDPRHTEHA